MCKVYRLEKWKVWACLLCIVQYHGKQMQEEETELGWQWEAIAALHQLTKGQASCSHRDCQEVAALKIVELGCFMIKLGGHNVCLLAPDLMTDQNMDTIEVQLSEPLSLLGLLTGTEITYRQLCHPSPPHRGWQSQSWTLNTAQPAGSPPDGRASFPSDSALNLCQAAWLVSACSRQLVWSQESPCSSACLSDAQHYYCL